MNDLSGKVALVTGGSSGIGAATVRRFIQQGAKVGIADIDMRGEALAGEFPQQCSFIRCDHVIQSDCQAAVDLVLGKWGRLDILHANAGRGSRSSFEDMPEEMFLKDLSVNLIGPWRMIKAALAALKGSAAENPETGSVILLTSSGAGLYARPNTSAYVAAKHGVVGLARSLAMELGPHNIRVNALCPGYVATERNRTTTTIWGTPEQVFEKFRAITPLGRITTPEDIANVAAFLASDEARAISAQALLVDGGGYGH